MSNTVPQPESVTAFLTQKNTNLIVLGNPPRNDYQVYLEYLKSKNVKHWFFCIEIDQSLEFFRKNGIELHNIQWEDGTSPPKEVIDTFLQYFNAPDRKPDEFIAVSCQYGYGRAPTIGAIALIEKGYSPVQTLKYLREINTKFITERQKTFVLSYTPSTQTDKGCNCRI